jgi:hypothetical protein
MPAPLRSTHSTNLPAGALTVEKQTSLQRGRTTHLEQRAHVLQVRQLRALVLRHAAQMRLGLRELRLVKGS